MKYKVTLHNKSYEVEVEEGGVQILGVSDAPAETVVSAPVPAAPANAGSSAVPAGSEAVTAPMPGAILDVRVSEGEAVKKGQVLLILEAMKMENEILSPADAVVVKVAVSKGATVEVNAPLLYVKLS